VRRLLLSSRLRSGAPPMAEGTVGRPPGSLLVLVCDLSPGGWAKARPGLPLGEVLQRSGGGRQGLRLGGIQPSDLPRLLRGGSGKVGLAPLF
jgi:hypothetical protein